MRTRHPFPDVELGEFEPPQPGYCIDVTHHPDATTKGIEYALGFMPHQGENRTTRRAAVANFKADGVSRRELLKQRQRQRRGELDPELRRLQRRKAQTK